TSAGASTSNRTRPQWQPPACVTSGASFVGGATGPSLQEDARGHDAVRVERALDGAGRLDPGVAQLAGQPVAAGPGRGAGGPAPPAAMVASIAAAHAPTYMRSCSAGSRDAPANVK